MRLLDIDSNTVQVHRQEKRNRVLHSWNASISAKDFRCSMGAQPEADEVAWGAFVAQEETGGETDSLANIPRKRQPTFVKLATGIYDEGDA